MVRSLFLCFSRFQCQSYSKKKSYQPLTVNFQRSKDFKLDSSYTCLNGKSQNCSMFPIINRNTKQYLQTQYIKLYSYLTHVWDLASLIARFGPGKTMILRKRKSNMYVITALDKTDVKLAVLARRRTLCAQFCEQSFKDCYWYLMWKVLDFD